MVQSWHQSLSKVVSDPIAVWLAGIWFGYIPGMVYTRYIPGISVYTHPPNQGLGIYPFLGLQLGAPRGPPGVLFGGHKGQFGSWGAPQSRNCTCYLLIDAPMVSVLTMVFVGADTGHKQTSCPYGPITMTCSDSRDPDLARCCSESRDVVACADKASGQCPILYFLILARGLTIISTGSRSN